MGAFRTSLQREIRHFGQSRLLVTSAIILPVVMTVLYVLMFWKGTVHDLPIAVYDGDRTELSRQLVRTPMPYCHGPVPASPICADGNEK